MLLAGSALGASPAQNLLACLGLISFGGMVIRHGALHPPPPFFGNQKSVKAPSPNTPPFFILSCYPLIHKPIRFYPIKLWPATAGVACLGL